MKKSLVALTLLLGLSAGVAVAAPTTQTASAPQQFSDPTQGTPTEEEALKAYRDNINPSVSVPTAGIYDERDRYTAPNGYELPGYGRLPPS